MTRVAETHIKTERKLRHHIFSRGESMKLSPIKKRHQKNHLAFGDDKIEYQRETNLVDRQLLKNWSNHSIVLNVPGLREWL
jgi:hypothetical protein